MTPVVLLRRGPRGAVVAEALVQEGIGFEEIGPEGLSALADGARGDPRVLLLPGPPAGEELAHVARWREAGGATILLGGDWPEDALLDFAGVEALPHAVSGGHLWTSSGDLALPALEPDRPLQITGERRLVALRVRDAYSMALGSAPPSAVAALDTNRDGLVDDEHYFCGPSVSRLSRGRAATEALVIPGLGPFAPRAAAAGDFTGDGFADDLLVAAGDTFALRREGAWGEPRRAQAAIKHALAHPGPGPRWSIHLFLEDGSSFVSSLDGGATFGPRLPFAPAGKAVPTDFSYSFDYPGAGGERCIGVNVWSGGTYYRNLGAGFEPTPGVADLGPRYLNVTLVRPGLGFCSDADRHGYRDRLTLLVGDNLYRLDRTSRSFDYPRSLHREVDVARWPLVVRRGRTIAFLFDFERTVRELQQGRVEKVSPLLRETGLRPIVDRATGAEIGPVVSAFDDWVDQTAWDLPQADLHERLLRQAIAALREAPLPRLWYWPGGARSIASISHDVERGKAGDDEAVRTCTLEIARRAAEAGRRDTFFVLSTPDERVLAREDVEAIKALGHAVTLHFNALLPPDLSSANLRAQAALLRDLGVERVTGNRTHALMWAGDELPRAIASEPEIFYDSTLGAGLGYTFCGSVLPYRVHDAGGAPYTSFEEVPEALMDVADATFYFRGIVPPGRPVLSVEELFERARGLAERNDAHHHGVVDTSLHPVVVAGLVPPLRGFLEDFAAYARFLEERGIPSMTLEEVAAWWRLRRGLRITSVNSPSADRVDVVIEAERPVSRATIVLPAESGGRELLEVSAGGEAVAWTPCLLDGAPSAMVVLPEVRERTELSARYRP